MRRPLLTALLGSIFLLVVVAAGCGGGGGGSRPPTVIAGNVRSASTASTTGLLERLWRFARSLWSSDAVAQVPGITVAIEGQSSSTNTDDLGFFRLEGNQFGATALRFSGSGADARYPLTLPAGGEVDLVDVDLKGGEITVGQHRIHLEGPITGLDCQASLMQVLSGSLVAFRVRFNGATAIIDPDGKALNCSGLVIGGSADVEGVVNDSGDVIAVQIRTDPTAVTSGTPTTFTVTLTSSSCPSTLLVTGESGNVQVNLSSATEIVDLGGQAIACGALLSGDPLQIDGTQGGFGINATRIQRIAPTPTPTATVGP